MDGCLDDLREGCAGRIKVIEGHTGRRQRSVAEWARIAVESLAPGAKVADAARRHGVTRWQVYDWRKKLAAGMLAVPVDAMAAPAFAALVVEAPRAPAPPRTSRSEMAQSQIDLVVGGVTVRVGAAVDEAQLTRVLRKRDADPLLPLLI